MSDDISHNLFVKYPTGKIAKSAFCEHCGKFNARHSACEVVVLCGSEVLLLRRAKDPQKNWWCLPGGYVEWGETLEQTALRELREETGIVLSKLRFFGIYSDPGRDLDGRQTIAHCFVAELSQKREVSIEESEVLEAQWFSFDALPEKIGFDHRQMIEDVIASLKQ